MQIGNKKYKIIDIKHSNRKNIYNLVVYDIKKNMNYYLYFKSDFKRKGKLEEYIADNPTLFIYNIRGYVSKEEKKNTRSNMTNIEFKESNIPNKFNTIKFYKKICSINGAFLVYVPEGFKTKKMCIDAVENDPIALRYVPHDLCDRDLIISSLSKNGICLQYVPLNERDIELCLLALSTAPTALRYVPEELRDYEMCLSAVKMDMRAINYVPDEYLLDVYKDGVIGMNRLLPISKKDYHYRDYKKIIEKLSYLSSINISKTPKLERISDDEDLSKLQLSTVKEILLSSLSEIEKKEQLFKNK